MTPEVKCLCALLLLAIIDPINSDSEGDGCKAGWTCTSIANCLLEENDAQTVFPCSLAGSSKEPRVCCPEQDNDAVTMSTTPHTTTTTTTPSTTTTRKKTSTKSARPSTTTPPISAGNSSVSTKKPSSKTTTFKTPAPHPARVWMKLPPELEASRKLLPEDCGRSRVANRIINGQDANIAEFPWMALIGVEDAGLISFICGGSLINQRYVLTAAHCSRVNTTVPSIVRLGEWNITNEKDCQEFQGQLVDCADPVVDVAVEQFLVHPGFGNRTFPVLSYDIALIRLASDVAFTDFIQPICLPRRLYAEAPSYVVAGWGVTDNLSNQPSPVLQSINVPLFAFSECNAIAPAEVTPLLKRAQFCAGGENGQDACRGDSGGPLTYNIETYEFVKGVVSLATAVNCAREGRPTVYTEVSYFLNWILANMRP